MFRKSSLMNRRKKSKNLVKHTNTLKFHTLSSINYSKKSIFSRSMILIQNKKECILIVTINIRIVQNSSLFSVEWVSKTAWSNSRSLQDFPLWDEYHSFSFHTHKYLWTDELMHGLVVLYNVGLYLQSCSLTLYSFL